MHVSSNFFVAPIGSRAVVLDTRRSRYFALQGNLAQAIAWVWGGCPIDEARPSDRSISKLIDAGIVSTKAQRMKEALPVLASASLYPRLRYSRPMAQPLGFDGVLQTLSDLTTSWRALRLGSMGQLFTWLHRAKSKTGTPVSCIDINAVVDAYYAARPFFPAKPICRLDAIALCLFLRRYGFPADFVLGVRLDPFVAHSWVQLGDVVVGEAHDRIRQFTPMLAV